MRRFTDGVGAMPEVMEIYRMAGEVDYMLRVTVADMGEFDGFYKRLIALAPMKNVTSRFAMERMKYTTAYMLPDAAFRDRRGPGNADAEDDGSAAAAARTAGRRQGDGNSMAEPDRRRRHRRRRRWREHRLFPAQPRQPAARYRGGARSDLCARLDAARLRWRAPTCFPGPRISACRISPFPSSSGFAGRWRWLASRPGSVIETAAICSSSPNPDGARSKRTPRRSAGTAFGSNCSTGPRCGGAAVSVHVRRRPGGGGVFAG